MVCYLLHTQMDTPLHVNVPYHDIAIITARGNHARLLMGHAEDVVTVHSLPHGLARGAFNVSSVLEEGEVVKPASYYDALLQTADRGHLG